LARNTARETIAVFRPVDSTPGEMSPESARGNHAHDHAGHDEANSIHLSDQALRNAGLTADQIVRVSVQTYRQTMTVPATVVEKPGRTRVQVATPMTGSVMHVHSVEGAAVKPGALLFQLQLTHEDLVKAQTTFVTTLGQLDVEQQEIDRLTDATKRGAVPRKILLQHQYSHGRLTAILAAQRESLRLHGLSEPQVEKIATKRRLLKQLQMFAPTRDSHPEDEIKLSRKTVTPVAHRTRGDHDHPHASPSSTSETESMLILQQLNVHKGQSVAAGETLAVLTDLSNLHIEGMAFGQDLDVLRTATRNGWKTMARFEAADGDGFTVNELPIEYLSNEIDRLTRVLKFYVNLPNRIVGARQRGEHQFVEWQHFPGQRLELIVPVAEWRDRIVVPLDALAEDGAEIYVFQQNGDHFDRVPVHVEYRDQQNAVIATGGKLSTDARIAMRGAHQLQMALKKKSGGGPDLHAGHSH